MSEEFSKERTLFIVKPDGVQRGLVGDILSRFERKGLKVVGLKMVFADRSKAEEHYSAFDDDWREKVGSVLRESYEERGKGSDFPYQDNKAAGEAIRNATIDYMSTGPVVAMVLQGASAVSTVRKLLGSTDPTQADIGTIRGDYTVDSYGMANFHDRSVRNLAHASGTVEEAEREIQIWFGEDELIKYNMAIDSILYDPKWASTREDLI